MFEKDQEIKEKEVIQCPYCHGRDIIKKGQRAKKHEEIQVYFCKNCNKKFTPLLSRNKSYPLRVILETVNFYNRLYNLEAISKEIYDK